MKKVFLIALVLISFNSFGQNIFTLQNQFLDTVRLPNIIQKSRDTTNFKLGVFDASGNLFKMYWPTSGISGITADNGLTASTSTNVQFGGTFGSPATLLHDTYITSGAYRTFFTGNTGSDVFQIVNSNNGAITGVGTNGSGLAGQSTNSYSIEGTILPTSTNTVLTSIKLTRGLSGGGTAANGIGQSFDFYNQADNGTAYLSNQIISKLTTAANATRTSQFIITGVNSGTTYSLAAFDGDGKVSMFGSGAPSTTLSVTNSGTGNGIETTVTGSGVAGQFFIMPSSTNTVATNLLISRSSSGTAAAGIGTSIDFYLKTSDATQPLSNQLISTWTVAADATRTSQFSIKGLNSATSVDLIKLNGDGSWQIRPITATAASAITPAEGMMLFVSNTNGTFTSIGFWGYQNGAWHAF